LVLINEILSSGDHKIYYADEEYFVGGKTDHMSHFMRNREKFSLGDDII
jgi:hypothetical protein